MSDMFTVNNIDPKTEMMRKQLAKDAHSRPRIQDQFKDLKRPLGTETKEKEEKEKEKTVCKTPTMREPQPACACDMVCCFS